MLKKTSASIGLVVATAAGILLSGAPAQAQNNSIMGCHSCFRSRHHSRNTNGNRTRPRIFIRIFIYNKNNNAAVARNGARQRADQLRRDRFRRRRLVRGPQGLQNLRGRGVLAPAQLTDPTRTRSVNEPVSAVPRINQSAPRTDAPPRDNGQISRNGVVHPTHGDHARQNTPGTEEAGQNGIKANPGTKEPNQDISSWLNGALS